MCACNRPSIQFHREYLYIQRLCILFCSSLRCYFTLLSLAYNIYMGHSYVHPQQSNHMFVKTPETISYPLACSTDFADAFDSPQWSVQPIIIPRFEVKCSPFKTYLGKDEFLLERATACSNEGEPRGLHFQTEIKTPQSVNQISWNSILYDPKILHCILDWLPAEDYINLSAVNRRFSCQMYLYRLFHRPNNWNCTTFHIKKKIKSQHNRLSFKKVLNESYNSESQHSLDLDRLDSLLPSDQNTNQNLGRVDKVMKAIHASGIGYFQGLNSIVIACIGQFSDEVAYWLVMLLLHKSQDVQDNPQMYQLLMQNMEKKIKEKSPRLSQKLELCDLGVEYFAMKWIMSLFSTDVCPRLLFHFWDLLINFGTPALIWFTVSLFANLQKTVMSISKADDLNSLMKSELRTTINEEMSRKILQDTRTYMAEQMFGVGCWEIIETWDAFSQLSQLRYFIELQTIHQKEISSPINPINEQQEHSMEETNSAVSFEYETNYETHFSAINIALVREQLGQQDPEIHPVNRLGLESPKLEQHIDSETHNKQSVQSQDLSPNKQDNSIENAPNAQDEATPLNQDCT